MRDRMPPRALSLYRPFCFVGNFLRSVLANSFNCLSLIEFAILLEAPRNDDLLLLPRLAASAAPAAICCFLDFAGILILRSPGRKWLFIFMAQKDFVAAGA